MRFMGTIMACALACLLGMCGVCPRDCGMAFAQEPPAATAPSTLLVSPTSPAAPPQTDASPENGLAPIAQTIFVTVGGRNILLVPPENCVLDTDKDILAEEKNHSDRLHLLSEFADKDDYAEAALGKSVYLNDYNVFILTDYENLETSPAVFKDSESTFLNLLDRATTSGVKHTEVVVHPALQICLLAKKSNSALPRKSANATVFSRQANSLN